METNGTKILFTVIIVIGIVWLVSVISDQKDWHEIKENGVNTIGVVIKKELKVDADNNWYDNTILYKNLKGDTFQYVNASSNGTIYPKIGDSIKIIYHRDYPERVMLDYDNLNYHIIFNLTIPILIILFDVVGYLYFVYIKKG